MENNEIFAALSRFQGLCPTVSKTKSVKVSGMSKKTGQPYSMSFAYADLATIWSSIRGPLSECGLSVIQTIESDDKGRPCIVTVIGHSSGQSIRSSLIIDYMGGDIKEAGGAITYYRRYTLSAALGIVSDDDADDHPEHSPPKREYREPPKKAPPAAPAPAAAPVEPVLDSLVSIRQVQDMQAVAADHPHLLVEAAERLKISDLSQMRQKHYKRCLEWMQEEIALLKQGAPCST